MSFYDVIDSPLGPVFLGGSARGWHRIDFLREGRDEAYFLGRLEAESGEPPLRDEEAAREGARQLQRYFAGSDDPFDLELAPVGTPFQRSVWDALLEIPRGEVTTYGALALRLGRPSASRAVGASVGRNPMSVVIPCHRVIGSSGALTGYASGVERKRHLLDLEGWGAPLRLAV